MSREVTSSTETAGSEQTLVRWLRAQAGARIGDDAAILVAAGESNLRDPVVTMDAQHAGVHFPADLDPAIVGRRLLAVNLSDLAAMGAVPRFLFLSFAAPRDYSRRRLLRSLIDSARAHGAELAGGDLSVMKLASLTLTVVGERPRRGRFLKRSAAEPGHSIWIGGTLGQAAIGLELVQRGARPQGRTIDLPPGLVPTKLVSQARAAVRRQLVPTPQLELGRWLGQRRRPVAAIDLSDGLGQDLARLCSASGVGALVQASALPMSRGAESLCAILGRDAAALALGGGEDYVLLFTLPPEMRPPENFRCTRIGQIRKASGVELQRANSKVLIDHLGWDHLVPRSTGIR